MRRTKKQKDFSVEKIRRIIKGTKRINNRVITSVDNLGLKVSDSFRRTNPVERRIKFTPKTEAQLEKETQGVIDAARKVYETPVGTAVDKGIKTACGNPISTAGNVASVTLPLVNPIYAGIPTGGSSVVLEKTVKKSFPKYSSATEKLKDGYGRTSISRSLQGKGPSIKTTREKMKSLFKQKTYAAPLLGGLFTAGNAVIAGTTGLSLMQGHAAAKQNEEIADQQRRSEAKTRAAIEKLANSDSPHKQEAASLFSDLHQKSFGVNPSSIISGVKNLATKAGKTEIGGFAKDLWKHSGEGVKKAAAMGAGFAGVGYLGNRIASSWKNHDEGRDDKNASFLKKAAIGAATVGGSILAAKKGLIPGKFGKSAQQFMSKNGTGGKFLGKAGKFAEENISPIGRKENGKLGMNWMNTAFMAMPVGMYAMQKGMKGKMANDTQGNEETEQQQSFSWVQGAINAVKKAPGKIKTGWGNFKEHPSLSISGGFNKAANFMGMMGTKGGTKATQDSVGKLAQIGKESGNKYTQKFAKWLGNGEKPSTKANLVMGAGVMGVGMTAMGVGDKLITKPMKAIDRDAYQLEEEQNGSV